MTILYKANKCKRIVYAMNRIHVKYRLSHHFVNLCWTEYTINKKVLIGYRLYWSWVKYTTGVVQNPPVWQLYRYQHEEPSLYQYKQRFSFQWSCFTMFDIWFRHWLYGLPKIQNVSITLFCLLWAPYRANCQNCNLLQSVLEIYSLCYTLLQIITLSDSLSMARCKC